MVDSEESSLLDFGSKHYRYADGRFTVSPRVVTVSNQNSLSSIKQGHKTGLILA